MHLSVPQTARKTQKPAISKFGKPIRSPRTPTPSSLTYSDTFENVSNSVNYSDTFESESKVEPTTIKTNRLSTIITELIELDSDIHTAKDLTKPSDSFPTYSDTFETEYSDNEFESTADDKSEPSTDVERSYTETDFTSTDETETYRTRTLESIAHSSTDQYSTDDFEVDEEAYSYSESYDYTSSFEPTEEPSTIIQDSEMLKKEEELKKISEEAKSNYISTIIGNLRNKRFKDTDITELSVIEPVTETKVKEVDKFTDNYSQRFMNKKMAMLKHKRKHGQKPVEERPWPHQKSHHVTEYGLDPQIVERLKVKNLLINMENAAKYDVHDPKRCKECSEYEREMDEKAAERHFIRVKKSQIQKDITENQFQQHLIKMDPINLIGELAKSLPRATTDPAIITEQLHKGPTLSNLF